MLLVYYKIVSIRKKVTIVCVNNIKAVLKKKASNHADTMWFTITMYLMSFIKKQKDPW